MLERRNVCTVRRGCRETDRERERERFDTTPIETLSPVSELAPPLPQRDFQDICEIKITVSQMVRDSAREPLVARLRMPASAAGSSLECHAGRPRGHADEPGSRDYAGDGITSRSSTGTIRECGHQTVMAVLRFLSLCARVRSEDFA
jgi:hypothetical protein